MDKITSIRIKQNNGTYSDEIPVSVLAENVKWNSSYNLIDILGNVNISESGNIQYQINEIAKTDTSLTHSGMSADALAVGNKLRAIASNTPSVVASTSAMTDTEQIYVLSTDGKWYYHNGSAWTAGGTYGAVATDTTLTQSGMAADAKVVGDEIAEVNGRLDQQSDYYNGLVEYGENRFYYDESRMTKDMYIRPGDGVFEPYSRWVISDFIPVDPDTTYVMAYHTDGRYVVSKNNYYALYDKRFQLIRPATFAERRTNTITTDSNTAYVRNSTITDRFNTSTIFVKKELYDEGIEHFIPYSVKFINDDNKSRIETLDVSISSLQNELINFKSEFAIKEPLNLAIENQKRYDVINGELSILTGTNYNTIKSAVINVNENEKYYYTGRVYNYVNQYSLIAIDNNNVPIKYELAYSEDTFVQDYGFVIPIGASKLIVQSYTTYPELTHKASIGIDSIQESINEKADSTQSELQYDNVVRSIQRIGGVGNTPHHSVIGYKNAYKAGFRILLCDLRFTSDNVPVLFHDSYLNQNYKDVYDSNGVLVPVDNPIYISQHTYTDLSQYDYGLYKGEAYRGYPLMTLYDMLGLCKRLGVEVYIEVKEMTEQQAAIACNAVLAYGMSEKTSWTGSVAQMRSVISIIDTARVSTMPSEITTPVINNLISLKTGKNKVFVFAWDTTTLTAEIVNSLIANDIAFEFGTLNTEENILTYFNRGNAYYYCTGIESDYVVAGKVIVENAII